MRKNFIFVLALVMTLVLVFAGCQSSAPADKPAANESETKPAANESKAAGEDYVIGFSVCSLISQFFEGAHSAALKTAEEMGVELVVVNADGDSAQQKKDIENLISKQVDAVIAIAQDTDAIVASAADCKAAGIPFIAISRVPSDLTNVDLAIAFSNEQSAEVDAYAMKEAAEDLGYGKVKVIEMIGDLNDSNAVERQKGFEAIAEELGFEIVATVATEWDVDTAYNRLNDTVQNVEDFNAIFAPSDILIPPIMSVLSASGRWVQYGEDGYVIITGIDGDPTAVQAVKEGYVYCTANNDALELGRQGIIQTIDLLKNGAPSEKLQIIEAVAVTKEYAEQAGDSIWGNAFAN
jgi:ribose transport system substrate-binding protein